VAGLMSRRRRTILASTVAVAVAFFFLVPMVPTQVRPVYMLPIANDCSPRMPASLLHLLVTHVPAYGSISYTVFEYILFGHEGAHRGEYGLVYVPAFMNRTYYGGYDFQFPPLGFSTPKC